MKRILLASLICCTVYGQVVANCYECACESETTFELYVGAMGGLNFLDIDDIDHIAWDAEQGYLIGGSVGYRAPNNARLELEIAYRHNHPGELQIDDWTVPLDGHIGTTTIMVNLLHDFDLGCEWVPSLGAGIGYGVTHIKARDDFGRFGGKEERFAYQGIAGLSRQINDHLLVGLEYRYLNAAKHADNHSVDIAIRHYF